MAHYASSKFWQAYARLPAQIRQLADKNFALLKQNPQHPALHFKKIKGKAYWSARVGSYRAVAVVDGGDYVWFWIGTHAEYDKIIQS
jgi:mRNA-degrading endonuclease RelE of RelBE toxin-antitoxin system